MEPSLEKGYTLICGTDQGIYAEVEPHPNALVLTSTDNDGNRTGPREIPMEPTALLEVAACIIRMDDFGRLRVAETIDVNVEPFDGANIDPKSLEITGIQVDNPLRGALPEIDALRKIFQPVRREVRATGCQRAILVGHNSFFDLNFLNAAVERSGIKRNPFHPFSSLDTATLGAVAYGQTVLARIVEAAGLPWDSSSAHSAGYDARITTEVFCNIVNQFREIYEARQR